jgi:hypothetical protein
LNSILLSKKYISDVLAELELLGLQINKGFLPSVSKKDIIRLNAYETSLGLPVI